MAVETIVLVHGAWHGGWCWDRVKPILEQAGYRVMTPTLPGLSLAETLSVAPNLCDHVAFISDVIGREMGSILLVGHSYAGMVVTGAADQNRDHVARLVYLDAAIPKNGQSFASHFADGDPLGTARLENAFRAMASGGDWLPPPSVDLIGIADAVDIAWVQPRLRPHPLPTWIQPLHLSSRGVSDIPKTCVLASDPSSVFMGYPLLGAATLLGEDWTFREISGGGHDLMVTAAHRTAELLMEAARG